MADFMQAYNWAKAGKKVVWINGDLINHTKFNRDYEKLLWVEEHDNPDGKLVTLNRNTKDGWEIFEEKEETLSDKIFHDNILQVVDVKEAIKKLKDDLEEIRKKCLALYSTHFVDYNYEDWNNPVDGLDYALHKIDKHMGPKLT